MSTIELVKGCPLFYELYDSEINKVIKNCDILTFGPGQTVVKEGDVGDDIFIMLFGEAEVQKNIKGNDVVLGKISVGDVFGELVLINKNERAASIVTCDKVEILVVNYNTIFELYEKNTKVFALLVMNLARLLTKRLEKSSEIIGKLSAENEEPKAA